ncbi:MAG: hypothetical protein ABIQ95_15395 [Bdellovibrionia bacterium]
MKKCKRDSVFAVYLDPPWNGSYSYSPDIPFSLDNLGVPILALSENAFFIATVVAIKLPVSFIREEIETLTKVFCCNALIEHHRIIGFSEALQQTTVYLTKSDRPPFMVTEQKVRLHQKFSTLL